MGGTSTDVESWSCNIHIVDNSGTGTDEALIQGALSQYVTRQDSNFSSWAWLDYYKFNEVSRTTGKYVATTPPNTFVFGTPIRSIFGGGPFQISLAVSWVTALQRGRASKGRIFTPTRDYMDQASIIQADGTIGQNIALAASVSAAQLITDLNGAVSGSCVVWSQVGQVAEEIIAVRVGNVLDTQRRRRRSLIEVYSETPVS